MLDSQNKAHLNLLYDEFFNINKAIKKALLDADLISADGSIQNKEILIKKILTFEKPYIEDIKKDPALLERRKYLILLEKENIELLAKLKQQAQEQFSKLNKTKKIYNAYEPSLNDIQSTIEVDDEA